MSDSSSCSSSDDEEESKFKDVCDPTLWRTADQDVKEDEDEENRCNNTLVVKNATQQHQQQQQKCDDDVRQSFLLLEKIKKSLSKNDNNKTMTGSPRVRAKGSGKHKRGFLTIDSNTENGGGGGGAPSTLSPYIAKQLANRLDGSVEYKCSQDPVQVRQESETANHPSLQLLRNVLLLSVQDGEAKHNNNTVKKRNKLPKRLSFYNSSDEDELKTRCSSVAVSHEWIQAGGEYCPRPHPKNVRYLDEYKVQEHRSDGSIIIVPSSTLDSINVTKDLNKRKKKSKVGACDGVQNGVSCKKENKDVQSDLHKDSNTKEKTNRKQARKRGKKKKLLSTIESSDLNT